MKKIKSKDIKTLKCNIIDLSGFFEKRNE